MSDSRLCAYCGRRPRFQGYAYCGKTCGGLARKATRPSTPNTPLAVRQPVHSRLPSPHRNPTTLPPATSDSLILASPPSAPAPVPAPVPAPAPASSPANTPSGGGQSRFAAPSSPEASRILPVRSGGSNIIQSPAAHTPVLSRDPSAPKCLLPECEAPPWRFGAEYCSPEHRQQAANRKLVMKCVRCKTHPTTLFNFCGQHCHERAVEKAPIIFQLDDHDPKFEEIRHRFDVSWKDTDKPKPTVKLIWKIVMNKQLMDSFFNYRKNVESTRNFTAQRMAPGNECRKWYGLRRDCALGDDPSKYILCSSSQCAVCHIMKNSFKKEILWTKRPGQYGQGIYSSALSSRADDFTLNGTMSSNKALMLATVIVGKGLKCTTDRRSYTTAPRGYDSVLSETGTSLAFDEVVVYDNDAMRPVWLVIYGP